MPELTRSQKLRLHADGFVVVPGVVSTELVHRALRAINHDLSLGIDADQLPTFNAQSFCPALCETPPILDLFERSGARQTVESATGPLKPVAYGQCALRWPEPLDGPGSTRPLWPHIDGIATPTNGVAAGTLHTFTALAGVLLSDLPGPDSGNFTVWPGSHRSLQRIYRDEGLAAVMDNARYPQRSDFGTAHQITGRAGDLVIAQYLLGHDSALNRSPHIRYAIYFRLESTALTFENRLETVSRPWRDWSGMADVMPQDAPAS
jgi:hypothetical protein